MAPMQLGLWVFLVCLCACPAIPPAAADEIIAPEVAFQAVRDFEGTSNLTLVNGGLEQDLEGPDWSHRSWYYLSVSDEAGGEYGSWHVDAYTGEVIFAYRHYAYPAQYFDDPPGSLAESECRGIAEDFARSHYSGFDEMGMVLAESMWDLWTWHFVWRQQFPSGAWAPNEACAEVDPVSGLVVFYSADHVSGVSDRVPHLTQQQAVELARQYSGITVLTATGDTCVFVWPDEVQWRTDVTGTDAVGRVVTCSVILNGDSGELISKVAPRRTIVTRVGAAHPVWIRDLVRLAGGASVHWLGNRKARVFVGTASYDITVGTSIALRGQEQVSLSGRVFIQANRLMVPADLLVTLKRR